MHNTLTATICFARWKQTSFFPTYNSCITQQSQKKKSCTTPKEYALILPHESYKAALICFPNLNYVIFSSVCIMENEQQQPSLVRIGCFFRESTWSKPKSWCKEALHQNLNPIFHSDSECCCQRIQDLFVCNCLILPSLQAQREPQPRDRQPNLA